MWYSVVRQRGWASCCRNRATGSNDVGTQETLTRASDSNPYPCPFARANLAEGWCRRRRRYQQKKLLFKKASLRPRTIRSHSCGQPRVTAAHTGKNDHRTHTHTRICIQTSADTARPPNVNVDNLFADNCQKKVIPSLLACLSNKNATLSSFTT